MLKVKGYIEGYYGKLLSWDERVQIVNTLSNNKMCYYFYAPKEDINHRLKWREPYDKQWLTQFNKFIKFAQKKKIKIIIGVSPGIDFNFKSFLNGSKVDINYLKIKIKKLLSFDVDHVALLFDDIPNNFNAKAPNEREGYAHAKIINEIFEEFNIPIFSVPRIYSDELFQENPSYLIDYFSTINDKSLTFYTGRKIVSTTFSSNIKIIKEKVKENKILYWDNFYANDYCPKKLFIGPWMNKNLIQKSMINGTGLIETDKLIIEIVNKTASKKNKIFNWKKILIKHKIPKNFFKICKPFLKPNHLTVENITYNNSYFENLEYLLWKWKTPLSLEWYPFLLTLKHDLLILNKKIDYNKILKTQTNPLQKVLLNRR